MTNKQKQNISSVEQAAGNNSLPSNYIEGLARVSAIVEHMFPFNDTPSQKFFRKWLTKHGVGEEDYMREASEGGTFVHKQLENYLLGEELVSSKYDDWVLVGQEAIEELEIKHISLEHYCSNEQVQGTIDNHCSLIYNKEKVKHAIVDWKTWGLAKEILIPSETWKKHVKPTDKLKKATIQLSLYRYLLGVEARLFIVEITKNEHFVYELEYIGDKKCKKIIDDFYKNNS